MQGIQKKKLHIDLERLDNSHKRLDNPHVYPVGLEESLFIPQAFIKLRLSEILSAIFLKAEP